MTEIEETFEEISERLAEARKHWDTYKTDYGYACKFCSDEVRLKQPNQNVFIMQPCPESERLLRVNFNG